MENKEAYQPVLSSTALTGQAYLVTFCLWNAEARDSLASYIHQLKALQREIDYGKKQGLADQILTELNADYSQVRSRYLYAYDQLMAQQKGKTIDLTYPEISAVITGAFSFLAPSYLENYAWCIMPSHVHWIFRAREKNHEGKVVSVSQVMESVKKHTARNINRIMGRKGLLWQKESFDTTLRDQQQLDHAIEYTLNNPVIAQLVDHPKDWPGCWSKDLRG